LITIKTSIIMSIRPLRRTSSIRFMFESITSKLIKNANEKYSTCDIPATWVNWLLCVTFGIQALIIGYSLAIGPIFLQAIYNTEAGIVGVLFSAGAGTGCLITILITCTFTGKKLFRSVVASPFDLCFALAMITFSAFVVCVPVYTVSVVGIISLIAFNDLASTILTEMQASITTVPNYSVIGPFGQVIRRCLNAVTAMTGPILFGISPRLPFIVAGSTTLCWTIMLWIAFKCRSEKNANVIADTTGKRKESVMQRMSFATSEAIRSMMAKRSLSSSNCTN